MIPLSLYIHFPWCVKKCPYCDFNSHTLKTDLPETEYIQALLANLDLHANLVQERHLKSIFMGGGTPSLFSAASIEQLLEGVQKRCAFSKDIEITLEANPGTVEQTRFKHYFETGINRISLGIQSFQDKHLTKLGRIHDSSAALEAIDAVKEAGFDNFNLDLMFGLPSQTLEEGLADLEVAIAAQPSHLSWYELTLEPNTYFWHHPPSLPTEDHIIELQALGQARLQEKSYSQYEVSAYSQNKPCQHNLNYWQFGDYLAIGAGAHGKHTFEDAQIMRYNHFRHPKDYLNLTKGFIEERNTVPRDQLTFEFMLNALRLKKGVPISLFEQRTGLGISDIEYILTKGIEKGWLKIDGSQLSTTETGYLFLNQVIQLFLKE